MGENRQLTAEVFIDTGKDFRPEDSLTVPYTCALGETVALEFDLSGFEHTCGFRFDPLLEDSSMVRLQEISLTYEDGETKNIDFSRIKTNSDVDFEPVFVYLHKDPKFFVDEALCLKLTGARVRFQVLELGLAEKEYWQEIKKHSVSEKEKEQLLGKLDRGEIDFALVEGFFEKRDYDFRLFRREKYLGVCAPGFIPPRETPLGFQELFPATLITREPGSGTREVLERALSEKGWGIGDFSNVVEISNMGAIKMMAQGGGGIAFLYEAAVLRELEEGVLVPVCLEDFPKYHDFTFIWRKNSLFAGQYMELLDEMERVQLQRE